MWRIFSIYHPIRSPIRIYHPIRVYFRTCHWGCEFLLFTPLRPVAASAVHPSVRRPSARSRHQARPPPPPSRLAPSSSTAVAIRVVPSSTSSAAIPALSIRPTPVRAKPSPSSATATVVAISAVYQLGRHPRPCAPSPLASYARTRARPPPSPFMPSASSAVVAARSVLELVRRRRHSCRPSIPMLGHHPRLPQAPLVKQF